jgi:two-component system, chemotaxis family, chemotaxis protein CheY
MHGTAFAPSGGSTMTKIMIIDDSSLSRRLLRKILDPAGYQVVEVASASDAIENLPVENPALVMLDLVMPEIHGLDLLTKLRKMDPDVRVVVATADVQNSTKEMAVSAGASGYVNKPFDPVQVINAVKSALR